MLRGDLPDEGRTRAVTAGSNGSVTFVSDMAPVKSGVATGGPPTSGEAKRRRYRAKHRAVQAGSPGEFFLPRYSPHTRHRYAR